MLVWYFGYELGLGIRLCSSRFPSNTKFLTSISDLQSIYIIINIKNNISMCYQYDHNAYNQNIKVINEYKSIISIEFDFIINISQIIPYLIILFKVFYYFILFILFSSNLTLIVCIQIIHKSNIFIIINDLCNLI